MSFGFPCWIVSTPMSSPFCLLYPGTGGRLSEEMVMCSDSSSGSRTTLCLILCGTVRWRGISVMPGSAVKAELLQPPSAPALEGFCWPCWSAMVHREDQWIEKSLAVWSKVIQSTWQAIWALTLPTEKPAAREGARWISKTLWHPLAEVYSRTKQPQFTSQLHDLQVFAPWQVI